MNAAGLDAKKFSAALAPSLISRGTPSAVDASFGELSVQLRPPGIRSDVIENYRRHFLERCYAGSVPKRLFHLVQLDGTLTAGGSSSGLATKFDRDSTFNRVTGSF